MKRINLILLAVSILILGACSKAPEKINFGSDMCHFCKMTIVDTQHAAQYVTKKGKQFKYDAIECVLNELSETGIDKVGTILVSDYSNPGVMTDATLATYLISKNIQSPMGANLSAFSKDEFAQGFVKVESDQVFTWKTINEKFEVN
ncbi:nitrous oxide reductase accessory protein NosL [Urechidicola vernalis]|uniref:Nitrous oxide reductase accessory protein NosL n=1 Tax=Urechidicola vernalis TaxID=3075600 RepID=A0ABU2Y7R6_9FLAO|nr:nitrous oxide reductase accessory protein NosL [Urechidicola sp. P050]MDT0554240.1 nitrous oxide reductase accessory protein NosL [Urechidicola sp. P050]